MNAIEDKDVSKCPWTRSEVLGGWPALATAGIGSDANGSEDPDPLVPGPVGERLAGPLSTTSERVVAPCGGAPAQGTVEVFVKVAGVKLPSGGEPAQLGTSGIYTENGPTVNGQGLLLGLESHTGVSMLRTVSVFVPMITRDLSIQCGEATAEGKVGPVTIEAGTEIPCSGSSMARLLVSGYVDLFAETDLHVPLPCEVTHEIGTLPVLDPDIDPNDPCSAAPTCEAPPLPNLCEPPYELCDLWPGTLLGPIFESLPCPEFVPECGFDGLPCPPVFPECTETW